MTKVQRGERLLEPIAVKDLHFDPDNPRLPSTVDGRDEAAVLEWMLRDASLVDLMGSIGSRGYFDGEPILVVRRTGGGYTVVEGNRRLAAVKLLLRPAGAPVRKRSVSDVGTTAKHRPKKLPALRFNARSDILEYLGYRHITGVKEWEPLAKARYVRQLFEKTLGTSDEARYRELARTIGSGKRADYVARLLTALALYERVADKSFFDIEDLSEDSVNFSLFLVALNHSGVVRFFGLTSAQDARLVGLRNKHLKEFVTWAFQPRADGSTVLGDSRNMGTLAKVVSTKRALDALRGGESLAVAATLTGEPDHVFSAEVRAARDRLLTARSQQHLVTSVDDGTVQHLSEVEKSAKLLSRFARDLAGSGN